jgi:hypothetical protein
LPVFPQFLRSNSHPSKKNTLFPSFPDIVVTTSTSPAAGSGIVSRTVSAMPGAVNCTARRVRAAAWKPASLPKILQTKLVGGFDHLEKSEFVNGKDYPQHIMEKTKCLKPPTS